MNPALTIWRKECRSFLRAPIAWCVFAGFTAVCGVLFTAALRHASGSTDSLPAVLCTQMVLALCIPISLFTMSLFSTEKATGTIETLMTAPVTDAQVVIGKFAAAFTLVCMSLAFAFSIFPVYLHLATPAPAYSPLSLYIGMVAVTFCAATGCALGTLISLLSRQQAPAAITTLLITLASAAAFTDAIPGFSGVGFFKGFDVADFARGTADTRIGFATVSTFIFLLFIAIRILESRRWSSVK